MADVGHDDRRITGTLVAADDDTATIRVDGPDGPTDRSIRLDQIDRAKTVFEWPVAKPPRTGRRTEAGRADDEGQKAKTEKKERP